MPCLLLIVPTTLLNKDIKHNNNHLDFMTALLAHIGTDMTLGKRSQC